MAPIASRRSARRPRVTTMPTVLDSLREHLLGDELADRLEQWLATKKMKLAAATDSAEPRVPPSSNVDPMTRTMNRREFSG